MKLTFFISRTKQIYAKTLTVSESSFKIKTMSAWALLEILLTSAVICKQRFLHEGDIVQYLQNHKYQDVNQEHFGKLLQTSTNDMKNDYPETAHTFFTGLSVLSYFLHLSCYNFCTAKSIMLHFLEVSL